MTFEELWNEINTPKDRAELAFRAHDYSLALRVWNEAIGQARKECWENAQRENGTVGARNCAEVSAALDLLLHTED